MLQNTQKLYNRKRFFLLFITNLIPLLLLSQQKEIWNIKELAKLPEGITNQSVAVVKIKNKVKIYSFYGLDNTKTWSGIHHKAYCFDFKKNKWKQIKSVPDSLGRIASASSVINNKVYIVGGYAVFKNHKEKSSSAIHIFNPKKRRYKQGRKLIYPIDDQVQAVYKDSLLYVVTGWSDSSNINKVQVYFPQKNIWKEATSVPNDSTAKVFGASGVILGDTLYYLGGASYGKAFPLVDTFYKGYINPKNPLEITWQKVQKYPKPLRYRAGVFVSENQIYWLGGSAISYNYNGISYKDKQAVKPNSNLLSYSVQTGQFQVIELQEPLAMMDIRNIGKIDDKTFILVGGMNEKQEVSKKVFLIQKK